MRQARNIRIRCPVINFDPNELIVGSVNHEDEHKVLFETFNDDAVTDASKLPELSKLDKNTIDYSFKENKNNQTHNGIGIDVNGDGLDEMAYFSLYYNDSGDNKGSSAYIDLFERVSDGNGKWKWNDVYDKSIYMQSDNYILDIIASESKGYVPLAAADFDGDGKEELAFYLPDKGGNKDAKDARVLVYKFNKDGSKYSSKEIAKIYIKDFTADYNQMADGWHLPTVALSVTSTRLGNKKPTSVGAAQYEVYNDLVITVSVPREYAGDNLDINSITKIFSFQNGQKEEFRYEYKPYSGKNNDMTRMNYVNTCDANLNGDGFKEIVVAGMKEHKMEKPKKANDNNRYHGDFDTSVNLVNIIAHNGSKYEMLWQTPAEVDAPGNLHPDHYNSIEPTALCAGHFMYGTPGTKDQICIQGVVLDCTGAMITGAPVHCDPSAQGGKVYITDTKPYYDKDNFPTSVKFKNEFCYDLSLSDTVSASRERWVDQCVAGQFFSGTGVQQIAILSSEPSKNDDYIYMDFSIISHYLPDNVKNPKTTDCEWKYKPYNDYISSKNEDDNGTSLFISFMNIEEDQKGGDPLPPDNGTPEIDKSTLPKATAGDPIAYGHSLEDVIGSGSIGDKSETSRGMAEASIINSPNVEMQGASLSFTDTDDNSGSVSLSASVSVKIGTKMDAIIAEGAASTAGTLSGQIGYTGGRTNSDGVEFSTLYYMPDRSLMDNVKFPDSKSQNKDNTYIGGKTTIIHYDPLNSSMYNYNATSVCTPMEGIKINRESVDDSGTNVNMDADDKVIALSFFTTANGNKPPEPPENFAIKSMARNNDGSADITLIWNSKNRNPERKADGYNIYMTDTNSNEKIIHLQNKRGLIRPSADSDYTTFTVHLNDKEYNDSTTFYIVPAYSIEDRNQVMEGTISNRIPISSIEENTNGNLLITKQPETYMMTKNTENETAVFSIDVSKNTSSKRPVSFFWQQYDEAAGDWSTVKTENVVSANGTEDSSGIFHSEYSFEIPGNKKDSYIDKGLRCQVSCGNYSVTSDIVTLRYGEKKPDEPDDDNKDDTDDEKNEYGISSYEELCQFAQNVQNNYERYKNASVYLDANINASGKSQWTLPIGTEDKPFCGTFDGKGYVILGLDVSVEDNGALFGMIGENGLVKDLSVLDTSFSVKSEKAGGIAAVNNGTIDHCISGLNTESGLTVNTEKHGKINVYSLNSYIKGIIAGGIAAENNGTITGTRNGSFAEGEKCGGIAGINKEKGIIYGCANNGAVGKNTVSVKFSGGLAGVNDGAVKGSYNAGSVNGNINTVSGSVAAENNSADLEKVYYYYVSDIPAVGSGIITESDGLISKKNTEMMDQFFTDELNNATDSSVRWKLVRTEKTYLNRGFPVIENNYLINREIKSENGILINGLMHRSMNVSYSKLAASDPDYSILQGTASGKAVTAAYNVTLVDGKGNYIPSELWCYGVTLSVPVKSTDVSIAIIDSQGNAEIIQPESVSDSMASFTVAEPVSFAVIDNTVNAAGTEYVDNNTKTGGNTHVYVDNDTSSWGKYPGTGDNTPLLWTGLTVLLSAAIIMMVRKRKNRE